MIANSLAPAPRSRALAAISTAMRSCGSPPPEKIGSFCPRTSEFIRSIDVMPVSMKSRGVARATGFSGSPSTRRRRLTASGGPPSITWPTPLNTRPSSPGPTPKSIGSPRKRTTVPARPSPLVGSSISIVTVSSSIAAMRPSLGTPPRPLTATASFRPTSSVRRRKSSGPSSRSAASCTLTLGCIDGLRRRLERGERLLDPRFELGETIERVFADILAHAGQRPHDVKLRDLLGRNTALAGALCQFDEVREQPHHARLPLGAAAVIDRRERGLAQERLIHQFGGQQRQALPR